MTHEYLSKKPKELFWLFWLGVPYIIWIYSIITELSKKIPKYTKLSKIVMIMLIAYPSIYMPIGLILLLSRYIDMDIILPFHYTAMICMFLLMVLTCITIIKFEKAERLKRSNGVGLFLGIWYFPIGIWIIQPKLNEYIKRIK